VNGTRQFLHPALVLGKESQGSNCMGTGKFARKQGDADYKIANKTRYPVLMYTESGQKIMETLWNKTLEELEIRDITTALGRAD